MDLIKKLGGYEKAKDGLHRLKLEKKDLLTCGDLVVVKSEIDAALIEYRREHNIFEVGDKVVYKGKAGLNGLFEIESLTKTGKPKTVKTEIFGNFPCRYCEVQHAADEEIAAGHRL